MPAQHLCGCCCPIAKFGVQEIRKQLINHRPCIPSPVAELRQKSVLDNRDSDLCSLLAVQFGEPQGSPSSTDLPRYFKKAYEKWKEKII